jgi:hypothetical protein
MCHAWTAWQRAERLSLYKASEKLSKDKAVFEAKVLGKVSPHLEKTIPRTASVVGGGRALDFSAVLDFG